VAKNFILAVPAGWTERRPFGTVLASRFWKIHFAYQASGPLDDMGAYIFLARVVKHEATMKSFYSPWM